ncbi:MAG: cupin domain-containing protein [Verrucomicrobiota bacterium]
MRYSVLPGLCLALLLGGCASSSVPPVKSARPPVMTSTAFDWDKLEYKPTAKGGVRHVVRASTPTLDELECHITTLNRGETSHEPHIHPDEEIMVVKEGVVEALVAGEWKRLGPGSVIFQASCVEHTIRNAGDTPATYHVFKWNSPGMLERNNAIKAEIKATKAKAAASK